MFVRNNDTNTLFNTIADAFTVANAGETIEVLSGYAAGPENFSFGIDNLTLILPSDITNAQRPDLTALSGGTFTVQGGNPSEESMRFHSGPGGYIFNGGDGRDAVVSGAGDDQLFGNGGNDHFGGDSNGAGDDLFDGGDGLDNVQYFLLSTDVTLDLQAGTASSSQSGNDTLVSIENANTGSGNDSLSGSSAVNTLDGRGGNDVIDGRGGNDILLGGDGNDILTGGAGNDHLGGGNGNDTLIGGAGDDNFQGEGGADTADYSATTGGIVATLTHGTGTVTGDGNDSLTSIEFVIGGSGDDTYNIGNANRGDDTFFLPGAGYDVIDASGSFEAVSNMVSLRHSLEKIIGTAGNDTITRVVSTAIEIDGGAGDDDIRGASGDDTLSGGIGADNLVGSAGADNLAGGDGDDTISGGTGNDAIDGGAGSDVVDYQSVDDEIITLVGAGTAEVTAHSTHQGVDALSSIERVDYADHLNLQTLLISDNGAEFALTGGTSLLIDSNLLFTIFNDGISDGDEVVMAGDIQYTITNLPANGQILLNGSLPVAGFTQDDVNNGRVSYQHDGSNTTMDSVELSTTADGQTLNGVVMNFAVTPPPKVVNNTQGTTHDTIQDAFDNAVANDVIEVTTDYAGGPETVSFNTDGLHLILPGSLPTTMKPTLNATAGVTFTIDGGALAESGTVNGSGDADHLIGLGSHDVLNGRGGNDIVDGGAADDDLSGGDGDDTLLPGGGQDLVDGGVGTDTISFAGAANAVSVDLATGLATGNGTVAISTVENIIGTDHGDTLSGDAGDNVLDGGAGTDTADYSAVTTNLTIDMTGATSGTVTGDGTDTLVGIELVKGGSGDDTYLLTSATPGFDDGFDGGAGFDTFDASGNFAGLGFIQVSSPNLEQIIGTSLHDNIVWTNATSGILYGGGGGDNLDGAAQDDSLFGEDGNDILAGHFGNDMLDGGAGDDTLIGGVGGDALDGGVGTDKAEYYNTGQNSLIVLQGTGIELAKTVTTNSFGTDTLIRTERIEYFDGGVQSHTLAVTDPDYDVLEGGAVSIDPEELTTLFGDGGVDENITAADILYTVTGVPANGWVTLDGFQIASSFTQQDINDGRISYTHDGSNTVTDQFTFDVSAGGASVTGLTYDLNVIPQPDVANNTQGTVHDTLQLAVDAANDGDELELQANYSPAAAETVAVPVDNLSLIIPAGLSDTLKPTVNVGADLTFTMLGAPGESAGIVNGDVGAETLNGGDADDVLNGADGDDTLAGAGGDDALDGGAGSDTVDYSGSAQGVSVDLVAGTATGEGNDTLAGIENVTGSAFADVITGDGNDNRVEAGAGDDTADGGTGIDTYAFRDATQGVRFDLGNVRNPQVISAELGTDLVSGFERADGSDFADVLIAANSGGELVGRKGGDSLIGRAGDDVLDGGAGKDVLLGKAGNDTFDGGSGDDFIRGGEGDDNIDGGSGSDTVDYGSRAEAIDFDAVRGTVLVGTSGEVDTLANVENVIATAHDDVLAGDGSDNAIYGKDGNDTIDGRAGNDTLIGEAGDDNIAGGDGNDAIYGGTDADTLSDGGGDDTVAGQEGDDILVSGLGVDRLDGGADTDTVTYDGFTDGVFANLGSRSAFFLNGVPGLQDRLLNIENLIGTGVDDTLVGSSSDNVITAGLGDDFARGQAGNDTLDGGDGNDTLLGDAGNDVMQGGAGDDFFRGGAGDDDMDGGTGSNLADYSDIGDGVTVDLRIVGPQAVSALAGNDSLININNLQASNIGSTLIGNDEANTLLGRGGDDTLDGQGGNDLLLGRDGDDILRPGTTDGVGVDTVRGDGGFDIVDFEGETNDITVDLGAQTAVRSDGDPSVNALLTSVEGGRTGDGNDVLLGSAGDDLLGGRGGDNNLDGGDGNDTLEMGQGFDSGTGGAGFDVGDYSQITGEQLNIRFAASGNLVTTHISTGVLHDLIAAMEGARGGQLNDLITMVNEAGHLAAGQAGDDTMFSKGNSDILLGEDGNDTIRNDTGGSDVLAGGDGDDVIEDLVSFPAATANLMSGGAGADVLTGGEGDDVLFGGTGDDVLTAGNIARGSNAGPTVSGATFTGLESDLDGMINDVLANMGLDPARTVIDLSVLGEARAEANGLDASFAATNALAGGSLFIGFDANDGEQTDILSGGDGNDQLFGANENHVIMFGGAGDDLLDGDRARGLVMLGGDGNDTLLANVNNSRTISVMDGGDGADTITGSNIADTLIVGSNGTATVDMADGGDGNDRLIAAHDNGLSELLGGAGNDVFEVHGVNQTVSVLDFTSGQDLFELNTGGTVVDFAGLQAFVTAPDTFVIGGLTTTLVGVDIAADLSDADFIFV